MAYRVSLLLLAMGCGGGGLPAALPDAGVDPGSGGSADVAPPFPDVAPPPSDVAAVSPDAGPDTDPPVDRAPARLKLDPPAADFGFFVRCDPWKVVTFRVTNDGGSPSGAVALDLKRPFIVKTDGCSGQELGAGATCEVQVQFEPGPDGSYTGMLTVQARPGGQVEAALKGYATHGDALTLTPNSADFGAAMVGTMTAARSFEMRNTGGRSLAVTEATVSTMDFVIIKDDCAGKPLAGGANCTVEVAFKPTTGGAKSAILTLTASGCGGNAIQASMVGTGISDGPSASPSSINFGTLVVGAESAPVTSTLTNTGGMPTGALTAAIEGVNASQFRIEASTCVGSLAPAASCAVTMVFRPTTVGDKVASLVISMATGAKAVVSLSGSGICNGGFSTTTPAVLEFGGVSVSAPPVPAPELIWTLHNISNCDPLGPVELKLAGPDAVHFGLVLNSCQGAIVPAGGKCATTVSFKPTTVGAKTAFLEFYVGSALATKTMMSGSGTQ